MFEWACIHAERCGKSAPYPPAYVGGIPDYSCLSEVSINLPRASIDAAVHRVVEVIEPNDVNWIPELVKELQDASERVSRQP